VLLLASLSLFGWRKVLVLRRKIRKETRDAEEKLHKMFNILRDDIREQVQTMERAKNRRALTAAEKRVLKKLQESLDKTEREMEKEINDIEKV
jgi:hypothetical protein